MGFNPFENDEQPHGKGRNVDGNFVENLGGDYLHIEGSVFNLQSDRDPPGRDMPPQTPPPHRPEQSGHRIIYLGEGTYHAYIDGNYIQGQLVNVPDEDAVDFNATPVDEDDDDAW